MSTADGRGRLLLLLLSFFFSPSSSSSYCFCIWIKLNPSLKINRHQGGVSSSRPHVCRRGWEEGGCGGRGGSHRCARLHPPGPPASLQRLRPHPAGAAAQSSRMTLTKVATSVSLASWEVKKGCCWRTQRHKQGERKLQLEGALCCSLSATAKAQTGWTDFFMHSP